MFRKLLDPRLAELVHTEYRKGSKIPFFHIFAHPLTHVLGPSCISLLTS